MSRWLRTLSFGLLLAAMGLGLAGCSDSTAPNAIHVLKYDGDVNPVMEGYIDRGLSKAEESHAKLVILELDTPGGFDSSMRAIVKRIERATVPVAVYVSPAGGRAASAGTFITMAANIAVMAPNTSIGAASAINSDGSDIGGTLGRKVENDAVAFIRGIAELRGRNADWAEKAVRDAIASSSSDAVNQHVVDFVAANRGELIQKVDGTETKTGAGEPAKLEGLSSAKVVETNLTLWERLLGFIADPTIASLLITIGFVCVLAEVFSPGVVLPGITGVICLALGFLGLGTLPINTVGLILIAAALVFFALEIHTGTGMLGFGGLLALVLGGVIAFRGSEVHFGTTWLVWALLAMAAAGFLGSIAMVVRSVRIRTAASGTGALMGRLGVARTSLAPEGTVVIQGERWQAQIERGTASEGDRVRVIGAKGFRLKVRREE